MCCPNGAWIGVTEKESTESEQLPSIAPEECEGKRLSWMIVIWIWKTCCQEEMLMRSRLKRMLNLKVIEPPRHR